MDGAEALARLDRALDRAGEGKARDDVLAALLTGRATVLTDGKAYLICSLHEDEDGKRSGHAWVAAGDMGRITGPLREWAEAWARANGASFGTINGSRGWSRAAPGYCGDGELRKVL